MGYPIIVPRMKDDGRRDMLWEFCKAHWQKTLPDWPIFEGEGVVEGLFSRSEAINNAAKAAEPWDAMLIIDGDVVLASPRQAEEAIQLSLETGKMVFAHNWKYQLNEEGTRLLMEEGVFSKKDPYLEQPYGSYGPTNSSAMAINRTLWEEINGFDERFYGWGCEDWAFLAACDALREGVIRHEGQVFHLWHTRTHDWELGNPHYKANENVGRRYLYSKDKPDTMRCLIEESRGVRDVRNR